MRFYLIVLIVLHVFFSCSDKNTKEIDVSYIDVDFTLQRYGDGGVDLSPIADLMKSEVYDLAAYLEVSSSIQKAQPTDGLFGDSRTDEDQIGASYDELEWAMQMQDENKTADEFSGREKSVFKIYNRLNSINQHKMMPIPICKIPKEFL